jgi:hypothetical protein
VKSMAKKRGGKSAGLLKLFDGLEGRMPLLEIGLSVLVVGMIALVFLAIQNPKQFFPDPPVPAPPLVGVPNVGPQPGNASMTPPTLGSMNVPVIAKATRDGGGFSLLVNSANESRINITGVIVDGRKMDFIAKDPDGGNGSSVVLIIPDSVDCSTGASVVFLLNYTQQGQNGSVDAQLGFEGCADVTVEDELILPPIACKGAAEPCFGDECCAGYYCNVDSWLCTTVPKGCADEGMNCGTEPCCSGLRCDEGTRTCAVLVGCGGVGTNCTSVSECCALNPPLVCRDRLCRFCSSKHEICISDSDCCKHTPAMVCVDTACEIAQCAEIGAPCEENDDCCGAGNECYTGVCRSAG